ncbi:MAG: alkyl sulfatase C-terminal domain-containing protein [Planctomycetota bacterium]
MQEASIDPEKSAHVQRVAKVTFSDSKKSWALHVRRGVAEVIDTIPDKVDVAITLPRLTWAQIVLGQTTLAGAAKSGDATIDGDRDALAEIVASFDKVTTAKPEPHELHN